MSDAHVDELSAAIVATQLKRERLQDLKAPRAALERNRQELIRLQWQLSYALIELHCTPARQAA